MGAILVRVGSASREPLDDQIDVTVVSTQTDRTVAKVSNVSGRAPLKIAGLTERQSYLVQVFPLRHRPVAQFTFAGSDDAPARVDLYTPLHPEHVRLASFPGYAELPAELARVLERSTVDGVAGPGGSLYRGLAETQKAGLLNLFSKMSGFAFDDGRTVWSFVDRVYGVRPDRIFADVQAPLRERVTAAVAADTFREVSGSLHEPPPGYGQAGSFKTADEYGNLQLTFFSTLEPPLSFKVDADIDDAAGLGHAFQVIRNWVTHGTTHPYDIHQILVFRQDVVLPYDLA